MTNTAKWGGEREREKGRGQTHDDRQKRADQTERPNCVKEKKKNGSICASTVSCELRGEIK